METIGVRTPNGEVTTLRIAVRYTEDDVQIAERLAKGFHPGTLLRVDCNQFRVVSQEPPKVELVSGESSEPPPESERTALSIRVGQSWVTKDPRRKQEPFEIVAIEGDQATTDKGTKIKLSRFTRYRLVD